MWRQLMFLKYVTESQTKSLSFDYLSLSLQTFLVGSLSLRQRLRLYWQDMWNKCDLTAIILFIAGVICRYTHTHCHMHTHRKLNTPKGVLF